MDPFRSRPRPRRVGVHECLKQQQHRDGHGGERRNSDDHRQCGHDTGRCNDRLRLRCAECPHERWLPIVGLRCAQERAVEPDQSPDAGQSDDPAQCEPHLQPRDGVPPRASGFQLHRPDGTQQPGGKECDGKAEGKPGHASDRQLVVHRGGRGRRQQEKREARHQNVAEPLHVAEEIVDALGYRQALAVAGHEHSTPVKSQDLHASQRPAKALLLEPVEAQGHQTVAKSFWNVDPRIAACQHPQARLSVLGHNVRVPAADFVEYFPPDQAHRPREDDRVAVRAGRHRDLEKVLIAVIQTAQILVVRPVAIVLRCLDEGDLGVGEMADRRAQPVRLHNVVGVDDTDDRHVVRKTARRLVEGTGLVPRPVFEVHELKAGAEPFAFSLDGIPIRRVGSVVVDHLNDQLGVVQGGERLQRLAQHLERLVVCRHLHRHPGQVVLVNGMSRF